MLNLEDVQTLEQREDATQNEIEDALQRAINDGAAWKFQGSYGRAMMQAIRDGRCMLGKTHAFDYYQNRIPARHEVTAGTKGSYEYVKRNIGKTRADHLAAL